MTFWMKVSILLASWMMGALTVGVSNTLLVLSVLFFLMYFSLPLLKEWPEDTVLISLPFLSVFAFWETTSSLFLWLILLVLITDYSYSKSIKNLLYYGSYVYALLLISLITKGLWVAVLASLILFVFFMSLLYSTLTTDSLSRHYEYRATHLADELSQTKRQLLSSEQMARQAERTQIARDIHDSVGHRLTALLMHLEVARVKAKHTEEEETFKELKELAQQSLKDTRTAVYALRSDETAGLQAIIQLIRKLETESHLEISFVIQAGVLNTSLSNKQSVVLYRSIQESLTNMMRHGKTRKGTVEFAILGKQVIQFKVSHAIDEKISIKEGFGLGSMRQRLEELGGYLSISQDNGQLTVSGTMPIKSSEGRTKGES